MKTVVVKLRRSTTFAWVLACALLLVLAGCGQDGPYQRKGDRWLYDGNPIEVGPVAGFAPLNATFGRNAEHGFYRGQSIAGSDGATFVALSEQDAKDRATVFHCDTYRMSQDYFSTRRNRIVIVKSADAPTYALMRDGYARDSTHVYFQGVLLAGADPQSLVILDNGFARDRTHGYYQRTVVPESDGATFVALDAHYARDRARVFYGATEYGQTDGVRNAPARVIRGAEPASFTVMDEGYARDAAHVYFEGNPIVTGIEGFALLAYGYAKTRTQVFYRGEPIADADAASFVTIAAPSEAGDAKDVRGAYQQGARVAR